MAFSDFADEPLDIEHLKEVLESRGYALIKERIELAIATNMQSLLQVEDIGMVRHTQGYIKGLKTALHTIPEILLEELKAKRARGNI